MTWAERREKMDMAIKDITIPFLRQQGFKGSYPHFRRERDNKLILLTFQFSVSSPKFVVEISYCSTEGYTTSWGKQLKPSECRVQYMGHRLRIGSIKNKKHSWYDFGKDSFFGNVYKNKAKEVVGNWPEAEKWWAENPAV